MDALKEHRLLLTLIGGVALSICVYMFIAEPAREEASQDLLQIDQAQIDRAARVARDAPTTGEIRLRREQRYETLRELYELYRVYLEWARPLKTYQVPGVEDDLTRYRSRLAVYLDEMQALYAGDEDAGIVGIRNPVPDDDDGWGDEEEIIEAPFSFAEGQADGLPRPGSPEELAFNRKQFWVLFELMQILRDGVQAVASQTGERPYCQIESLRLPVPARQDESGLFQGIPFELTLHASVELWPYLTYAFHESAGDPTLTSEDLERLYQETDGIPAVLNLGEHRGNPGGSSRIGLRFDRIRPQVGVGPIYDEFSVRLAREELAQDVFLQHFDEMHWNDEAGRVIAPPIPESTLRRIEGLPDEERATAMSDAFGQNQQAFLDRMIQTMYEDLRDTLGPEPSHLTLTIRGEAIDFMHDLESPSVRFWDRLLLSPEDVAEMLKRGVDETLPEEPEAWPSCDILSEQTTNLRPVYVPYPMVVSPEEGGRHELDPYTPYRLSEEALRLVAEEIAPEREDEFE